MLPLVSQMSPPARLDASSTRLLVPHLQGEKIDSEGNGSCRNGKGKDRKLMKGKPVRLPIPNSELVDILLTEASEDVSKAGEALAQLWNTPGGKLWDV
jgi:hypothetical protein